MRSEIHEADVPFAWFEEGRTAPAFAQARSVVPYILMMCLGLVVVILVPWVTLVVPALLKLN